MKVSHVVPKCSGRLLLTLAVGILITCVAALAPRVAAAPGSLDPTFGSGGKVLTGFGDRSDDRAAAVAIQSDGRIVVAGTSGDAFAVARYNLDGTPDSTFGTGGKVVTTPFGEFSFDQAHAVAIQADGKIVVAGSSDANSTDYCYKIGFALARYNTNGTPDTTFGIGGKVVTSFMTRCDPDKPVDTDDEAFAIAIQADGKIVVAGKSDANSPVDADGFVVCYKIGFALARYNTDGTLDTTFSGNGKVLTGFSPPLCDPNDPVDTDDEAFAMVIQADGKIVVAGFSDVNWETTGIDFALARYKTTGLLDNVGSSRFGTGGKVLTDMSSGFDDQAFGLALQPDGKIVAVGLADSVFGVARYTTGGAPDPTFGKDGTGIVTTEFGDFTFDQAAGVAIQADGKIVVVGTSNSSFAVARYSATGDLDLTFADGGKVTPIFGVGSFDQGAAVALQSDGKIVVVGTSTAADGVDDFALARYVATADTTPPDTSIVTGPTGNITVNSATFTWTGTDDVTPTASLTYAFRLDPLESTFSAFGSAVSKTYTGLGNGPYTFSVKARDEAGNEDATPASRSFTVNPPGADITAPDTSILTGPTGNITVNSATFTWTGTDDVTPTANLTYAFRLDPLEPTFSAFGSAVSKTYTGLATGPYTFYVKARDQAGNEDATPASRSFTVSPSGDTVAPETIITSGPRRTMTLNEVDFTWRGSDNVTPAAGLTYAFRLDPIETTFSAFGNVVSKAYLGLPNGDYTFYVKARDQAGNEDPTPATLEFTIAVGTDLAEVAVSDPPASATPGTKFAVTDTVKNLGSLTASRSTTRYYLGIARQRSAADRLLPERRAVPSLDGGAVSTGRVIVTIPSGMALGRYYLLVCADATQVVHEVDEGNNCRASAATVLVGMPDLVETFVSSPPLALKRGDVFQVTDTVRNQGTFDAASTTTRYYLSAETVKRLGAKLLGSRVVPALAPGDQSTDVATLTVPRTTAYSTYYLLACADDTKQLSEGDETNNCVAAAGQVTVGP